MAFHFAKRVYRVNSAQGMPLLLLELDDDGLEGILSALSAVDLVMAERTCRVLARVVRHSARVWHMVALKHVECPRSMLDAETKADWRFWRGVCVALTEGSSNYDDLLGHGNGICTASSENGISFDPNYLLVDDTTTFWASAPINEDDAMHAQMQLSFHQLFSTEPTAEELEYLGCLVSEVRLTPHVLRSLPGQRPSSLKVFSPREAAVAFTCNGVIHQVSPRRIAHAEGEQIIARFDPPLLLSPGFAALHGGKMTVTLIGAYCKQPPAWSATEPPAAASRYSVRLSRLRCLGRQIRCLDFGGARGGHLGGTAPTASLRVEPYLGSSLSPMAAAVAAALHAPVAVSAPRRDAALSTWLHELEYEATNQADADSKEHEAVAEPEAAKMELARELENVSSFLADDGATRATAGAARQDVP